MQSDGRMSSFAERVRVLNSKPLSTAFDSSTVEELCRLKDRRFEKNASYQGISLEAAEKHRIRIRLMPSAIA
jgi:hypothetical protein